MSDQRVPESAASANATGSGKVDHIAEYAWRRHRFTDLAQLGEAARAGGMAFGPVTIRQGERLLTLLAEAVQYQEAHAHGQQLRAEVETECGNLRDLLAELLHHDERGNGAWTMGMRSRVRKALGFDGYGPEPPA